MGLTATLITYSSAHDLLTAPQALPWESPATHSLYIHLNVDLPVDYTPVDLFIIVFTFPPPPLTFVLSFCFSVRVCNFFCVWVSFLRLFCVISDLHVIMLWIYCVLYFPSSFFISAFFPLFSFLFFFFFIAFHLTCLVSLPVTFFHHFSNFFLLSL